MINGNYKWEIGTKEEVDIAENNLHPVILQLLKKRGIITQEQIQRYIYPKLSYLYDPMLLKDIDKAVERIKKAILNKEKIVVYGDYDADGITSCAIVIKLLEKLGALPEYYIPSRLDEGYGLNTDAIQTIADTGAKLIITVDNGISAAEEVDFAKKLGLDIVITDHHEPSQNIPNAVAIVNPKQRDCNYPFKELAGVGVALKLACAFKINDAALEKEFLELAAVGTIADVVPLLDENRIIVKNGLAYLENPTNNGLKAMLTQMGLNNAALDTGKIGYLIAPRLNAAGRIGNPETALELLLCKDEAKAYELSSSLEKINQERQAIEVKIFDEAKVIIEKENLADKSSIIVISNSNWHPGVVGTVASKLVELYKRPCIVISENNGEGRGSGRSIPGFNLFEALSEFSDLFMKFGGHEQAVGLTIKTENIRKLTDELNCRFNIKDIELITEPILNIDLELNQDDISLELAKQLELMEPFGYGNTKPVFACKNLQIQTSRTVGSDFKHLKLRLKSRENNIEAIGFNFGGYKEDLDMASIMDIAFFLEVNRWNGNVEPQLNIKDLKVPFFRDELLIKIENKYYANFNSYLTYLNKNDRQVPNDIYKNKFILPGENPKAKIDYIKSVLDPKQKTVIIINTPYKAWEFAKQLQECDDISYNEFEIVYNIDSELPKIFSDNIVAINPAFDCGKACCDNIVFYDAPFNENIFKKQLAQILPDAKIHLLFNKEDLRYNYLVCRRIFPTIDELKIIYQVLSRLFLNGSNNLLDLNLLEDILKKQLKIDFNKAYLLNVLKVFQEMDIIRYKIDGNYMHILDYKKNGRKIQLEFSDTYMNLYLLKKSIIDFYSKL